MMTSTTDQAPKRDSMSQPRTSNTQRQSAVNGNLMNTQTTDEEHNVALLEHLSSDLSDLLNRVDFSDCYLNVNGTYMAVHKCILAARSGVFAAAITEKINQNPGSQEQTEIETTTKNNKLAFVIKKTDVNIMKYVIIFMYTGRCELNDSNCYALLDAAGRYDIKDLKVHTARYLSSRITSSNVLMLLKAAYKYQNKMIQQRCIEFFINNAKEIMDIHELWKKFAEENKEIVTELLYWLVNREAFYNEKPKWDASSVW